MRSLTITFLVFAGCGGTSATEDDLERLLSNVTTDCGSVEITNSGSCDDDTAAVLACLGEADRPHALQVLTTVEGDEIYEHFFVEDDGTIVLLRDTRQDAFGSQEVSRIECSIVELAESASCARLSCRATNED